MTHKINPKLDDYFDGCLYFSVSRLQRNINKLAEEAFQSTGLAPSHAFILMALDEQDYLTPSDIVEIIGIAPSTVTRFIDKLEKQKLCTRTVDGRTSIIKITAKGRKLKKEIQSCWKALFHQYNDIFGKNEAAKLNKTIVKFNNILD